MGNIIMVTSCKGGVGKTTVSANLAYNLACSGKRVVAVDMDFGVRSLDIALRMENSAADNAFSLITEEAGIEGALVPDPECKRLYMIFAPNIYTEEDEKRLTPEGVAKFLRKLSSSFDYVILDMPAGMGKIFGCVAESGLVDSALVVTTHSVTAIRAAARTGAELYGKGIKNSRLIINMFSGEKIRRGIYPYIIDIIDTASVKLLGVVPYDTEVDDCLEEGKLLKDKRKSKANRALQNTAQRLLGENVPILQGIIKPKKRVRYY